MKDIVLDNQEALDKPLIIKGKKHFLSPGIAAGYILLGAGVIGFINTLFFAFSLPVLIISLFVGLIGLILSTTREGFLLNFEKRRYCRCTFFLGKAYGTWVSLPDIDTINVVHVNYNYTVSNAITPSMTFKENNYKVMLYVKDAERGIIVSIYKKHEAYKVAKLLAATLMVPIEGIE